MTEAKAELRHVAVVQCAFGNDASANLAKVSAQVREAARQGAQIVVLPELIAGPYFPQQELESVFSQAASREDNPQIKHFASLARELEVVLPVSFFERCGNHYFNSCVLLDADGSECGFYRKSHIPTGPGYEEKFYFRPGAQAPRAWHTRYGKIGVAICWDQWFPEVARLMALDGADLLIYPTAIGSEPEEDLDTMPMWRRAMQGHAVCNTVPVAAANRTGVEGDIRFYGSSFVADHRGEICASLGRDEEGIAHYSFAPKVIDGARASFGLFRDRRPELYRSLGLDPDHDAASHPLRHRG